VTTLSLADKTAQFEEFFMIAHKLNVNVKPLSSEFQLPNNDTLEEAMPYAFRIASEMATIEAQALRPLRNLGDHAAELVAFLSHQSRKIDLMMSYILHQQDNEGYRCESIRFGGGGLVVKSSNTMAIGTPAEIKIFLTEEAAAVFCYGEVIACEQVDEDYALSFIFTRIRQQDQELLVRATLHLQTQQLRKRSQQQI
jgi:hypothetical protein